MSSDICEIYQLVIVLDVHPSLAKDDNSIESYLNAVMCAANIHLASSGDNALAIIVATHAETRFVYPKASEEEIKRQTDGRLEILSFVDATLQKELKKTILSTNVFTQSESLLPGALGRALLYIRRQETLNPIGKKVTSKVLIMKNSSDSGGQYLNYINMYLTAQKMKVAVDTCIIGHDSGLMQQGADITGGYYHKINNLRQKIMVPASGNVDYRAACFCHRTLVDMAHVCSNCLSVYCKAVPLCSTCNVFFRVEMPMRKAVKKKR